MSNLKQVFTKKHFEWLADWIAKYRRSVTDGNADYVAQHLANHIGAQHPSFDLRRFLERAGVKQET